MIPINVSRDYKMVWWAPPRCGTRSLSVFLWKLGNFKEERLDVKTGEWVKHPQDGFTHACFFPPYLKDYTLICSARNPYSRLVSLWSLYRIRLEKVAPAPAGMSALDRAMMWLEGRILKEEETEQFREYLRNISFEEYVNKQLWSWDNDREYAIDFKFVSQTYSLKTKVLKLETLDTDVATLPFVNLKDPYTLQLYNENIVTNKFKSDANNFKTYYTEDIANRVYERFKSTFEIFGYNKDTWK